MIDDPNLMLPITSIEKAAGLFGPSQATREQSIRLNPTAGWAAKPLSMVTPGRLASTGAALGMLNRAFRGDTRDAEGNYIPLHSRLFSGGLEGAGAGALAGLVGKGVVNRTLVRPNVAQARALRKKLPTGATYGKVNAGDAAAYLDPS